MAKNKESVLKTKETTTSLGSMQINNPQRGTLNIREDKSMYITYKPLANMVINKRKMRLADPYAFDVYLKIMKNYENKYKEIEIDVEELKGRISRLNPNVDPVDVINAFFSDKQKVKFRVYTGEDENKRLRKYFATLVLYELEEKVINFPDSIS